MHKRLLLALLAAVPACVERGQLEQDVFRLNVSVTLADGSPLPASDNPLCLDLRGLNPACPEGQEFQVTVEAIGPKGTRDTGFNGWVRVSTLPGTVLYAQGDQATGRNIQLINGYAANQRVRVVGAFGDTHLQVEDVGYLPADALAAKAPGCADGIDNDGDGLVDYPADPGCSFSNDDTEGPGTYAAGVSPTIFYQYPTIEQVQGYGAGTPFSQEGVYVETKKRTVVVSRVAGSGFFVADVERVDDPSLGTFGRATPHGGLYVFSFGVPPGIRVCDQVTYLSGTMDEFYGYTEMGFPSYQVKKWDFRPVAQGGDGPCLVPEPAVLAPTDVSNDGTMETHEASLVRVENVQVGAHFGPGLPQIAPFDLSPTFVCQGKNKYTFSADASNCDLDRSGSINFTNAEESTCACFCYQDPDCVDWVGYQGRGNFRVRVGELTGSDLAKRTILVNTGSIPTFDPRTFAGKILKSVTGTVANFSGGDLNWTIETRCADDLVTCPDGTASCEAVPQSSQKACVRPRTASDNDAESN